MVRKQALCALIALIIIASLLIPANIPLAANPTDALTPKQIIALTQSGVTYIQTIIEGHVMAPNALFDENFSFWEDPEGGFWEEDAQTGVSGSGFIVTPEGYIVTNAHVVKFTEDYKKFMILKTVVEKEVESQIEDGWIAESEVSAFSNGFSQFLFQHAQIKNVTIKVYASLGKSIPGIAIIQEGLQAEIKKVGDPSGTGTGKDIAILKVESSVALPTVKLGDSSKMAAGEKIYCIGYPGVATFHPYLKGESATVSTVTAGIISAVKQMPGGWYVLQTDAAIYHGNSGGPAFNEKGEAIGISTFGTIDYNTGQTIEGFNFLVPINLVEDYLNELGATPHQGQLDERYETALNYMWNSYYSKALDEFTIVNQMYPAHPYTSEFIQLCRTEIDAGHDKKDVPVLWIIIGLIVVSAALVTFILMRRKKGSIKNNGKEA